MPTIPIDDFDRLLQADSALPLRPVCIVSHLADNTYSARRLEWLADGSTSPAGEPFTVTNLAEVPAIGGLIPPDSHALAVDAGGRWLISLAPPTSGRFCGRIVSADGNGLYTVREQSVTATGDLTDASGAANVQAINVAEWLHAGGRRGVPLNTRVLVWIDADTDSPPNLRYLFSHPTHANYAS
jgi:hypothetical protein